MHMKKMFKKHIKHQRKMGHHIVHGMGKMGHPMRHGPHHNGQEHIGMGAQMHYMTHGPHHGMGPHMEHMAHPMMHKGRGKIHHIMHEMGHHKMHHHKMRHNKKHNRRCYSSSSSSSSTSSSSDSEDEILIDGVCSIQIEGNKSSQEKTDEGDNAAVTPTTDGDVNCQWKVKCKKNKHFKLKGKQKKDICNKWSAFDKMIFSDAVHPEWNMSIRVKGLCRDRKYEKGRFSLPPPDISPQGVEAEEEQLAEGSAAADGNHQRRFGGGPGSPKRRRRLGDNVDFFMQSIAEQVKKLEPQALAQAKLKILKVVNDLLLADKAPRPDPTVEEAPGPSTSGKPAGQEPQHSAQQ